MSQRQPLDPALRVYLNQLPVIDVTGMSDDERAQSRRALMVGALDNRASIPGLPNRVETRDLSIAPHLAARLYTPPGAAAGRPVLVYLHGGGWVVGSVATHDPFCRLLSDAAETIILSVEYRLAPQHRCPAALEDTLAAARFAAAHAAGWGGDPARLALGGDSAGGHLAAVATNRLQTSGEVALAGQLLLYPVTDHYRAGHPSYAENAVGYGLEAQLMRWFWDQYAPDPRPEDPDLSPLRHAALPPLPPTLVATAGYDVLRDEGLAYAAKLRAAGVAVTHLHAPDMNHNFPVHPGTVARFPQSDAAMAGMAAWVKATL